MRRFSIGEQVVHKLFGKGTILAIGGAFKEDGFGDGVKLTVEFKGNISKVIISKYLKHAK